MCNVPGSIKNLQRPIGRFPEWPRVEAGIGWSIPEEKLPLLLVTPGKIIVNPGPNPLGKVIRNLQLRAEGDAVGDFHPEMKRIAGVGKGPLNLAIVIRTASKYRKA
jgi:hypothetical protein